MTGLSGKQFQDSEIADGWSETNPIGEREVGDNGVKPTTAESKNQDSLTKSGKNKTTNKAK